MASAPSPSTFGVVTLPSAARITAHTPHSATPSTVAELEKNSVGPSPSPPMPKEARASPPAGEGAASAATGGVSVVVDVPDASGATTPGIEAAPPVHVDGMYGRRSVSFSGFVEYKQFADDEGRPSRWGPKHAGAVVPAAGAGAGAGAGNSDTAGTAPLRHRSASLAEGITVRCASDYIRPTAFKPVKPSPMPWRPPSSSPTHVATLPSLPSFSTFPDIVIHGGTPREAQRTRPKPPTP